MVSVCKNIQKQIQQKYNIAITFLVKASAEKISLQFPKQLERPTNRIYWQRSVQNGSCHLPLSYGTHSLQCLSARLFFTLRLQSAKFYGAYDAYLRQLTNSTGEGVACAASLQRK